MYTLVMRESKALTAFWNRFMGYLPKNIDPNHRLVHHKFLRKLPARIKESIAIPMFNDKKNICRIVTACDRAWKSWLATANKRSSATIDLYKRAESWQTAVYQYL